MSEYSTLRKWLNDANFNWNEGRILIQIVKEDEYGIPPGYAEWNDISKVKEIDTLDPILDAEFSSGLGSPEAPRFLAKDKEALYFPTQYDGATSLQKVYLYLEHYFNNLTPYP